MTTSPAGKTNSPTRLWVMTSAPGQDRNRGFREGIAGSGIEVIFDASPTLLSLRQKRALPPSLNPDQ